VLLGLGLLSHHELGSIGWRWFAIDVIWAVGSGIGTGVLLGTAIGYLVLHLRRNHRSAVGLDDFLTLGLIALTYGGALLVHGYGFLAVFAAGLALRRLERRETGPELDHAIDAMNAGRDSDEVATDEKTAPVYMAQAILGFNEQLERIGEVAVVVVVGALLFTLDFPFEAAWFIPLLFFVIRPAAVWIGLLGTDTPPVHRRLIGWFGLRGIGSLYYLLFAATHRLESDIAAELAGLVLLTIAASVVLHGTSVTPLMVRYQQNVEDGSIDANAGPHRGIETVS
jgi:NhaP-type Na+/H+ or K+/H+ antiporter